MMAIASKLSAIGILVFSLATGFLTFYLFSDLTMEQKKKHIEELFSQIITFIIFICLGKVTLNFSIFISDPIAILAYPSDSKSFYFAVVLHAIYLAYKSKVKNFSILPLLDPFLNIFLIASFVYEFIQYEIKDNPYAFGYLILLAILIGIYFFLRERFSVTILLIVIVTVWSIGMVTLAVIQPYVTVFGYLMAPWFVTIIFVMSISGLAYKLKKEGD